MREKTGAQNANGVIKKIKTAVQILEEYRTALITVAVTGELI